MTFTLYLGIEALFCIFKNRAIKWLTVKLIGLKKSPSGQPCCLHEQSCSMYIIFCNIVYIVSHDCAPLDS